MNFLYIPEMDNMVLNMDRVENLYIHDGKLHIKYADSDISWHRIDCKIKQVQYRMDMFFLGGLR